MAKMPRVGVPNQKAWPHSPFRAATAPSRPSYWSIPIWRCQGPTFNLVGDHMNVYGADVLAFSGMAYLETFPTEEALFAALWKPTTGSLSRAAG